MTTSNTSDSEVSKILLDFAKALRAIDRDRLTNKISPEVESTHRTVEHMKAEVAITSWAAQEANKARIDEWRKTTAYIQESFGFDWYPADFKAYRDTRVKELTSQNHLEDRT